MSGTYWEKRERESRDFKESLLTLEDWLEKCENESDYGCLKHYVRDWSKKTKVQIVVEIYKLYYARAHGWQEFGGLRSFDS